MKKLTHAKSRAIHIARQRVYDQIKQLRELSHGETMEMRLHGRNLHVSPPGMEDTGTPVVYIHRGRVGIGHVYKDNGGRAVISETSGRIIYTNHIAGVIVKCNGLPAPGNL